MSDSYSPYSPSSEMVNRAVAEVKALRRAGHPIDLIAIEMATEVARLADEIEQLRAAMTQADEGPTLPKFVCEAPAVVLAGPPANKVVDLMAALEESIAAAKASRKGVTDDD